MWYALFKTNVTCFTEVRWHSVKWAARSCCVLTQLAATCSFVSAITIVMICFHKHTKQMRNVANKKCIFILYWNLAKQFNQIVCVCVFALWKIAHNIQQLRQEGGWEVKTCFPVFLLSLSLYIPGSSWTASSRSPENCLLTKE